VARVLLGPHDQEGDLVTGVSATQQAPLRDRPATPDMSVQADPSVSDSQQAPPCGRPGAPAGSAEAAPPRARRRFGKVILCLFALVFAVKTVSYLAPEAVRFPNIFAFLTRTYHGAASWYDNNPDFHSCRAPLKMSKVPGGYVCYQDTAATGFAAINARIFTRYPLNGGAREAIYSATGAGSVAGGKDMLRGVVDVPRYRPVALSSTARWRADPYKAVYWRFYYYSLRPTVDLLSAYKASGQRKYAQALLAMDASFFREEASSPWAWSDPHAVAFRALVLTYEWWELRRLHVLTLAQSAQFLSELEKTANFLADPNHYQPQMNHGTNESAALLELAVDFPSLPGASHWLSLARTRLAETLSLLIDRDGVLIENSPYYHFYELDKYWQIYQFSVATSTPIAPTFRSRLSDMIRYATYILQPDDSVPLLGASLGLTLRDHGTMRSIAQEYPQFRYVLTHGASGERPSSTSVFFKDSGRTVMRSGWGSRTTFADQAYLTFNVGKYRTAHSSLDALGFTLYANGKTLLPGPGLYTYRHNEMRQYFHGTASHNTVVVDGQSQNAGDAYAGPLTTRGSVTYQSGESSLYAGVDHQRTLMMLDPHHFLVIDRLRSGKSHTYQQMFHLFPGARLVRNGLTVSALGESPAQSLVIRQLGPPTSPPSTMMTAQTSIGRYNPPSGLCSVRYEIAVGCYAVAYTQHTANASYTTLLSAGRPDPRFSIAYEAPERLIVHDDGRVFHIALGESPVVPERVQATHPRAPVAKASPLAGSLPLTRWRPSGPGGAELRAASDDGNRVAILMRAGSGQHEDVTDLAVHANLATSNLQVRLKMTNVARIRGVTLAVYNRRLGSSAKIELRDAYVTDYSGEWMTISLGREAPQRADTPGHWELLGSRFDWGSVDGVRLTMHAQAGRGPAPTVQFESISSVPQPRSAAVVFVFDDGYESIMPGAAAMHSMGMPGNVAVIGKYVELPTFQHLNVYELRMLQNQWGWNLVNHTQKHVDAVAAYSGPDGLGAYEQDLLGGATFLQRAGLNSAPNWFIYPHGTTNAALGRVVGRFYTFARTTDNGPEAFPFGSPLRVKTLELHNPGSSGEGASGALTSPEVAVRAARDALRYHNTLFLTFHRLDAIPSDHGGYPMADFLYILRGLKRLHAPVVTVSQLDRMNGVPETAKLTVRAGRPSVISVNITGDTGAPKRSGPSLWLLLVLFVGASAAVIRHRGRRRLMSVGGARDQSEPVGI
jgi:Heparinase II/III-like protein/Heparinase II/III N-terminus